MLLGRKHMKIAVEYTEKTYGTGTTARGYMMKLSQYQDTLSLVYHFKPTVYGHTDNFYGSSDATVYGAKIELNAEEAVELAHLLLYSVQHAKITNAPVDLTYTREAEA